MSDSELDRAVARKLGWSPPAGLPNSKPPSYSTSWCAVSILASAMPDFSLIRTATGWNCNGHMSDTAARAVCLAFLA